ncbi:MAG: DUF465 domain-containing protein [Gammaproteobacteria bacterium]|nr:DUF465 domain-containing protein [Gammaproteobacteria bacterium]
MLKEEEHSIMRRITELGVEHRDLDRVIAAMSRQSHVDQLLLRRLKKRKLFIKDMITKLRSLLIPDLDA